MGGHRGALREESFPISSFIGIPIPVPLSTSSVHFAGWIGNEGWRKESKYRVFYGLIQAGRDVLPIGWEEYRQTGIYRSSIESKVLKAISFPLILMQVAYWVGGPTGTQKQIGAGCAAWNDPIRVVNATRTGVVLLGLTAMLIIYVDIPREERGKSIEEMLSSLSHLC